MQYSNAAIEIKAGTTTNTHTTTTNNAFQYSYDMRYPTSSLGNNSLDPHLATATDWGGAAYLALSGYGTVASEHGNTISINSTNYYTTTDNITGLLNFGNRKTSVSCYAEDQDSNDNTSKLYQASNSRLVNVLTNDTVEDTIGMCLRETYNWYHTDFFYHWPTNDWPMQIRIGVMHTGRFNGSGTGWNGDGVTYRPAIWN